MAVMHVPTAASPGWPDDPAEPVAFKDLLDLRNRIDLGKRNVEVIEGRIVVSPKPVLWNEKVCFWLDRALMERCDEKGWFIDRAGEILLPATSDLIEPDVMILRDEDLPDLESQRPLDHVLLVAEVVSRSSIREDREVKPRSCALAGVPLYLLVDRFTRPLTISLFSSPGPDGYAAINKVTFGEKLPIPEPFGITLDTRTLPQPR